MKVHNKITIIISTISLLSFGLAQDVTLSFGNIDAGSMEILIDNSEDVYGFQFNLTGVNIISADAGGVIPGDWMLSASGSMVLGFSLTGSSFPAGSGVLVNVAYDETEGDICIEGGVVSGAGGTPLDVGYGDCLAPQTDITLSFGAVDEDAGTMEVLIENNQDVYGFQFNLTGVNITNADAGEVVPGDWMLSASGSLVLGFSLMGTSFSSGSGVLVNVTYLATGGDLCIENGIVSGLDGVSLSVGYGDCITMVVNGCTDGDACNFDPAATVDDGSCEYPEDNFDCDGNCLVEVDCADVCGGSSEEDNCGVCDDDPSNDCALGCTDPLADNYDPDASDDDGSCEYSVNLEFGAVNIGSGTMEITISNPVDVYGFQFNVTGLTITGAEAGEVVPGDWMISASGSTVLGFSLTGSSFSPGSGVLINLTYDATGGDACIENGVVSGYLGAGLDVNYGDCVSLAVQGCTDSDADNFDSEANEDDGSCEYTVNLSLGDLTLSDETSGSVNIFMDNPAAVSGFQFDVSGMNVIGASGGSAADNGFEVSTNGTTVIGFSLTGGSIAEGSGLLTTLEFDSGSGDVCLSDIFITSTSFGFHNSPAPDECDYIEVSGCTDSDACNFDSDATNDDGSCEYDDDCGICDGDGSSCEAYVESSVTTSVDESELEDMEGFADNFEAFVETALSLPAGTVDVTNITLLSRDDIEVTVDFTITLTEEELAETDFGSSDDIADALDEVEDDVESGGMEFIEGCTNPEANNYNPDATIDDGSCETSTTVDYNIDMHAGANLISLWAFPEDNSVSGIMADLGDNATGVIGEGVAASHLGGGTWVGSLSTLSPTSGYWVKVNGSDVLDIFEATPTDPATVYNLHTGANLISFPFGGSIGLSDGIPDDVEPSFIGVIGEGVAASQIAPYNWVGSLSSWSGTKGYWAKVGEALSFSFNAPALSRENEETIVVPYEYEQSMKQAFYFIETVEGGEIGDWILAYNGEVLVGAREWKGAYTDVPAMGYDDRVETAGYCVIGSIPSFYLVKSMSGETIRLDGITAEWKSNGLFTVESLTTVSESIIPKAVSLEAAYPNPFNPETTIQYSIDTDAVVELVVFDMNGRIVSTLQTGFQNSGEYSFNWNAENQPSGVYFAQLTSNGSVQTTKLLLLK